MVIMQGGKIHGREWKLHEGKEFMILEGQNHV
jgi:hypothetical protein